MSKLPILKNILGWGVDRMSQKSILFTVAFIVGLLTGTCAFLLKKAIGGVSELLVGNIPADGPDWMLLVWPVVGIVLTGIYVRYILRDNVEHGVAQLLVDIADRKVYINPRLMYGSMVASTLTLGFGGSAGSEGPIACTGAAIGSNVARWCGLSRRMVMIMIGCGAGAGIAGIFKAPFGGMLFTLEVLKMELTTVSVIALIIAAVTASTMAYVLSGMTFDLPWIDVAAFDTSALPYIIVFGVFCGFYSYYYAMVMKKLGARYGSIRNPWVRNISSGAALAVILFFFPMLYGEGYSVIGDIINGNNAEVFRGSLFAPHSGSVTTLIIMTALALLVKCWAACSSNSGGGVAGDFAPTLFAGALAGLLFATGMNELFDLHLSTANFALVGMASVMAGAIRAPLMAIFLTVEMAASYTFFLPILIGASVSYAIVKSLTPGSFYTVKEGHENRRRFDSDEASAKKNI